MVEPTDRPHTPSPSSTSPPPFGAIPAPHAGSVQTVGGVRADHGQVADGAVEHGAADGAQGVHRPDGVGANTADGGPAQDGRFRRTGSGSG